MNSRSRIVVICFATGLVLSSCAGEDRARAYRAEKMLFKADKMRTSVMATMIPSRSELLDPTISAYRNVVARFNGYSSEDRGIENVVLTAQLTLARLELDTDRVAEARKDFLAVLDIEPVVDDARRKALISAARISKQMREPKRAFELYEQFYASYLSLEQAGTTAAEEPDYLDVPLELADLCRQIDRKNEEALWLQTAETLYEYVISNDPEPAVLEAARFKLLTAIVRLGKWDDALELSRKLTTLYRGNEHRTQLLLLEAHVHEVGKRDPRTAEDLYRHIYEQYPKSADAPKAMLAHAALRASQKDTTGARTLYERVATTYARLSDIASQAEWQLAQMDEASGNWVDASLQYKDISRQYPGTQAAFDAPLRLASGYLRIGARDAAQGAYTRALEEYGKVARGRYPVVTRLVADEHILQVLTILERWDDVVRQLTTIADRYPAFERTHRNYIKAAGICKDKLGDDRRADGLLTACTEKFPGTDAAREAMERIGLGESKR